MVRSGSVDELGVGYVTLRASSSAVDGAMVDGKKGAGRRRRFAPSHFA